MKTFIAFSFMLCLSITLVAQAPPCAPSSEAVQLMWNKYGRWKPFLPYNKLLTQADKAIYNWKKAVNNRGKTFHRPLEYSQVINETLRGARFNTHTYISAPATEKAVTLSIQKRSGKGKVSIQVCTTTYSGGVNNVYSYTFEPNSPATTRVVTIDNAKGKVISIRLEKETGSDFTYRIEDQSPYPPLLCYASSDVVKTMWDEYGNWNPLLSPQLRAQKASRALIDFNNAVNNNGNTTGPHRSLEPEGNEVETLQRKTHYTYVMAPTNKPTIKLTLIKRGGQAETEVSVCTTTKTGDPSSEYSYTFEKGNYTRTQQITINNARRKVISINIKNSDNSGTFEYQLKDITQY